jgi:hypothetical protein
LLKESKMSEQEKADQYPQKVEGIPVKLKAEKIHFLIASAWGSENNQKVGEYVVYYSDGSKQSIPLLYNQALIDWWVKTAADKPTNAEIAWSGSHTKNIANLFKYTWTNPSPQLTIDKIDFVSTMTKAAPFMIALTCEPIATKTIKTGLRMPDSQNNNVSEQVFDVRGRVMRNFSTTDLCRVEKSVCNGLYFMRVRSQGGDNIRTMSVLQ